MASTVPIMRGSSAGRKPTIGMQQQARVELLRAIGLDEGIAARDRSPSRRLRDEFVARARATASSGLVAVPGRTRDRAIERHPGHDLRMREVPRLAAHFPDAGIGLRQMPARYSSTAFAASRAAVAAASPPFAACMQRVRHLAEDIELQLRRGRIADAHRLRVRVTRRARSSHSGSCRSPATPYMICNLRRVARDRAQQPIAPRLRFFVISGSHERLAA